MPLSRATEPRLTRNASAPSAPHHTAPHCDSTGNFTPAALTRARICFALPHLEVDLFPDFPFDLARVPREKRKETLLPRVDHIDLMQGHLYTYTRRRARIRTWREKVGKRKQKATQKREKYITVSTVVARNSHNRIVVTAVKLCVLDAGRSLCVCCLLNNLFFLPNDISALSTFISTPSIRLNYTFSRGIQKDAYKLCGHRRQIKPKPSQIHLGKEQMESQRTGYEKNTLRLLFLPNGIQHAQG